jgi:methyl-accepting chemotaxis protein
VQVVNDINVALGEQNGASRDIARQVERIATVTVQNGAAMQSVQAAVGRLGEVARSLQEALSGASRPVVAAGD